MVISTMQVLLLDLPDFDVCFSLLDIRERNNRSHGVRRTWYFCQAFNL